MIGRILISMRLHQRGILLATFGVGPLLLVAGCGGDAEGARSTLVPVQETSYVLKDPVTTTTTAPTTVPAGEGVSTGEQVYTVVSGDSVYRIAGLYDVDPEVLASYNSWSEGIQHPLQIGDAVKIPPGSKTPGAADAATDETGDEATTDGTTADDSDDAPAPEGVACTHTIVEGEFPNKVARQYDISVDELRAANPGGVMDTFLIGAELNIPENGNC